MALVVEVVAEAGAVRAEEAAEAAAAAEDSGDDEVGGGGCCTACDGSCCSGAGGGGGGRGRGREGGRTTGPSPCKSHLRGRIILARVTARSCERSNTAVEMAGFASMGRLGLPPLPPGEVTALPAPPAPPPAPPAAPGGARSALLFSVPPIATAAALPPAINARYSSSMSSAQAKGGDTPIAVASPRTKSAFSLPWNTSAGGNRGSGERRGA